MSNFSRFLGGLIKDHQRDFIQNVEEKKTSRIFRKKNISDFLRFLEELLKDYRCGFSTIFNMCF